MHWRRSIMATGESRQRRQQNGSPTASIQGNDYRLATHYRGSKDFIGGAEVFALWFIWRVGSYYKSKFWYVRRPPLEHGADRLTPSPDMDCDRLRQGLDPISVLQHRWLEYFPGPAANRAEQDRPDPLRRGYPAGTRGAFPRHHCRSVRPRQDARESAPCPRT